MTEDFISGDWSCVHSSGHSAKDGMGKSAGILIMVSRKAFRNIAAQEHVPGRLLQVRAYHNQSQHNVDILGLYQHVHRTTLSASQNRRLRQGVWHALQQTLDSIPARNKVILAGDFNSTLRQASPGVGPSVPHPDTHDNYDDTLQQILLDYELCALNTWHARPKHTFFSTSTKSQLDYLIVKCTDAGATAKLSAPLQAFPVTGDRLSNHIPAQATLQLRPLRHLPKDRKAQPAFDRAALHQAIENGAQQAGLLQQAVSARVEALPAPASINSLHQDINNILLQETSRFFPPQDRADHRVSADPGYRASAARTWALYRAVKRPGVVTLANILQRWRAVASFHRASKELKQQSRQLKVAFHQDQLRQAEEAASSGNLRELFQITRRLGPRKARVASRLKDENGNIMTEQAELAAVLKYGQETFAALPDSRHQLPLLEDLTFDPEEIWHELTRLKHRTAVPSHCAPSAVWKLCAQALHQPLSTALNIHFKAGRGCADAIHRVHRHFEEVEQIIQKNQSNRFTMRQGHVPSRCAGGACLSLDLSKAFDFVDRNHLTDALLEQGIPPNVVAAIQQLHKQARYHYDVRSRQGSTLTTNGIKQGCRVAPALWLCYSISVLQVNYQKTALLLTLHGKDAEEILAQHTVTKEGQTFLKLRVLGVEQHLCIRDSHIYLGTVIAYRHRLDLNITHRIESAQARYQLIRRILNGKGPLSAKHKLRLWNACISPCLCYGIEAVGWTQSGVKRLNVLATRHIRAILKQPAHLTHISNADIWITAQLKQPSQAILDKLANFILSRDPTHSTTGANIVVNADVHTSLRDLQESMKSISDGATSQAVAEDIEKPAAEECRFDPVRIFRAFPSHRTRQLHHNQPMTAADLEASIFEHCMPTGAAKAALGQESQTDPLSQAAQAFQRAPQGGKRQRGPGWGRQPRMQPTPWHPPRHQPQAPQMPPQMPPPYPTAEHQIDIISKLILKHEEALHNLRKDTAYVLFFRQDEKSLVPNLMEVARQWREKATSATPDPGLQSPLRTVLINCLLKELLQRTQRVVATEAGRADLQKVGWLDSQGHWTYLKWSPQQRRLVLNEARSPITHDTMVKTITELQASMTGEIIHRFKSKQPMWAIEEEGSSQAVFDLEIALRGATSDEVHQNFGILAGNAVTNLIGLSMKRDDRPRQPQAQQLAQLRHILPHVFRTIPTAPINAMAELGFFLMGWLRPHLQHDVVELADFLIPRMLPDASHHGWESRQLLEGELRRVETGTFGSCLSLSCVAPKGPCIQDLLQEWHMYQSAKHAVLTPPPWLFLQLPRAHMQAGRPCKRHEAYILPEELLLPCFEGHATLNVRWTPYVIRALITHHGEHLATGHYRTLVREGGAYWLQDDARRAVKASEAQLTDASSCVYRLLLLRKPAAETATVAPSSSSVALRRSLDDALATHQPEHELVARASSICHTTAIDDPGSSDRTDEIQNVNAGAASSTASGAASTLDGAYALSQQPKGISSHPG
ncbi:Pol [Symbiodinium sp. CCMP2592]|nr:Pol [Symbiodinium sp. CCMP2592]